MEVLKPDPKSLRVLQICHKPPYPPRDGGCMAMHALTTGLLDLGHRVRVFAICTHKHPCPNPEETAGFHHTGFVGVHVDTALHPVDAFSHLIRGKSYNIARFDSPAVAEALRSILRQQAFDVVLVESLFMAPYLQVVRALSDAVVVLRAHNVEHVIWSDLADATPHLTRRTYLRLLAAQLKRFEVDHLNAFDALLCISEEDASTFRELGCKVPMQVAPFGLDLAPVVDASPERGTQNGPMRAFHLGAMDWEPNLRGVRWLVDEVWPLVRQSLPDATLQLAGRRFPTDFEVPPDAGIEVLGEIPDASALLSAPGVMTIPLRSGSGMRIKAVEGAAAGRPIVSTSIGAEGLHPAPPFRIADDAEAFAQALIVDLSHPAEAAQRGMQGAAWARAHYHNPTIVANFAAFCQQLIAP